MSNPPFRGSPSNWVPPDPFQQAVHLHQRGELAEARRLYKLTLRQHPNHFDALHFLGVLEAQRGDPERGEQLVRKALRINPGSAEAYSNLGNILRDQKKFDDALENYERALRLRPEYVNALNNHGTVLIAMRRFEEAVVSFERAAGIDPQFAAALYNRGVALVHLNRLHEALSAFDRVLCLRPDSREARADRAAVLMELGRTDEALAAYDDLMGTGGASILTHYNKGVALLKLGRRLDALESFERVLEAEPRHAGALTNSGNALLEIGRTEEAVSRLKAAVAIEPGDEGALNSLGVALMRLERLEEALVCFDQVLARRPADADALTNRGTVLQQLGRHARAVPDYERVVREAPTYKYARGRLLSAKMYACDWSGLNELIEQIRADVRDNKFAANPFTLLACSPDEREQLLGARTFASDKYPPSSKPLLHPRTGGREKIRVAYVSGEFRAHATSYLVAGLLESHDRSRFEIFGVSTGNNDRSDMRQRIERAFDTFADGSRDTDRALAEMLDRWEIDIAVNLNGYFGVERTGVFALRPCPIQVNYLGFPGTLGADYIDYIIADDVVIPHDHRDLCAERVVYLPHSYQANDSKRPISDVTPARAQAGLPGDAFVFCCFNSNHKILPSMFDIWCRILRKTDNSVLWLMQGDAAAVDNLKREAAARQVEPDRLVFAPRAKLPDHLARHRLADLFLDTLPHNAHTTASDALWAGLPVLTCRGSAFAGRVAASLLRAVGMEELVTDTLEEYEALAIALARDTKRLGRMKRQLSENQRTLPLFDTARYARHLESAYAKMWDLYCRGEKPQSFSVSPAA